LIKIKTNHDLPGFGSRGDAANPTAPLGERAWLLWQKETVSGRSAARSKLSREGWSRQTHFVELFQRFQKARRRDEVETLAQHRQVRATLRTLLHLLLFSQITKIKIMIFLKNVLLLII